MRSLVFLMLLATPALADEKALAHGNTEFAADLHRSLASWKGNLFCSPYSISSALGMTWAGARGVTAKEMATTLHFGAESEVHAGFEAINASLVAQDKPGYQLSVANKLYVQNDFKLLDAFVAITKDRYRAPATQLDFAKDASRVKINQWVESQTHDRITGLLAPGSLSPASRLVLVNAVYFKGKWVKAFEKSSTRPEPFTSEGKTFDVQMMHTDSGSYAEAEGVQVLGLDYLGGDLSLIVVLPREKDGLAALEKSLDATKIEKWVGALQRRDVQVSLPRFRIERTFDLVPILKGLGIKSAFAESADFSAMTGKPELILSAVVHKAFVEVNEEGTEAAAATANGMMVTQAYHPDPPVFRADHPFLFMLRDRTTGTVLFLGRVVDPR